jgi:hypothetical protein
MDTLFDHYSCHSTHLQRAINIQLGLLGSMVYIVLCFALGLPLIPQSETIY